MRKDDEVSYPQLSLNFFNHREHRGRETRHKKQKKLLSLPRFGASVCSVISVVNNFLFLNFFQGGANQPSQIGFVFFFFKGSLNCLLSAHWVVAEIEQCADCIANETISRCA